jgi:hypothetical protein
MVLGLLDSLVRGTDPDLDRIPSVLWLLYDFFILKKLCKFTFKKL